jgi:hypothetical protein
MTRGFFLGVTLWLFNSSPWKMAHLQMVYLLKMVIFRGYVKQPDGSFCFLVEKYVLIMFEEKSRNDDLWQRRRG